MDITVKYKRRLMLEMGKPGVCKEKLPRSPNCIICQSPKVLYRVAWNGYCKDHRAEATKEATTRHLHRQVRNEAQDDLMQHKFKHAREHHVPIIPKRRMMK